MKSRTEKLSLRLPVLTALVFAVTLLIPSLPFAADAMVYSVYKGIDLGNPNETQQKDFFVNLGTNQGIKVGTELEVARRTPTYDLTTEKLYKDLLYPFARMRVIHAEKDASIARIEKYYPSDKTPIVVPRAVIVGDLVRPVE